MIKITRGLDLPIAGAPEQRLEPGKPAKSVALIGFDYHGMKPSMLVKEGDRVKLGQALFTDKKNPGVLFTSPGAGVISAINRGARRVFQSIVIALEGDAEETFTHHEDDELAALPDDKVRENLLRSGLWTAFRTRPFSKTPAADATPASIFVTAVDTHPLAANPEIVIAAHKDDFARGIKALARLAKVFVCAGEKAAIPGEGLENARLERFSGPHPAGLPGTHIHFLDPVDAKKTVWQIGYQDVIAIGKLFFTGRLWVERVVSLAGPVVTKPRLLQTRLGANLADLTEGAFQADAGEIRIISGSVFGGRAAAGALGFLGRFHQQISCLQEGRARPMLPFLQLGVNSHSVLNIYLSKLLGKRAFRFTTTTNGSPRAMVPVGNYEAVMPLDILPTHLLRYLIIGDTTMAQKLGALELDEEDLALCSYVCAGKYEYGPILRDNLTRIEKEG
ncbi:MAG: Na(+)-translocating NADH-quinone reductase subunit A [Zoogloeaceae bacterium]|jgi:Na+-transporting NADH:ubiquinone oxidoreductase subunit A|nr:Na(+)-translocating NADH-quinone reductase subunit A [Zoogloeaceae bacterium]